MEGLGQRDSLAPLDLVDYLEFRGLMEWMVLQDFQALLVNLALQAEMEDREDLAPLALL